MSWADEDRGPRTASAGGRVVTDDKEFVGRLARLAAHRAPDVLTEHEFALAKAQVLGSHPATGPDSGAGTMVAAPHRAW